MELYSSVSMRVFQFLILPALLISITSKAQLKHLKTFEMNEVVVSIAIDRSSELYFTTSSGQIHKYDIAGLLKHSYKSNPTPTLFDPRDGARIFIFNRESRTYLLLGPSLEVITSTLVDSAFFLQPWLMCPGGDFNIWGIDAVDASLKKINTRTFQVDAEVKLDSNFDVSNVIALREYQSFVFMLVKDYGIVIFNNIGKHIRTIKENKVTYFNFLGEELYYLKGSKLQFFNLFTADTREIELPTACNFALVTDERFVCILKNVVKIFEFKP